MSEREGVDPVEELLTALESEDDYVRSWKLARQIRNALATHDEQVRADALAPVRALAAYGCDVTAETLRAALPPERLAGEAGAE